MQAQNREDRVPAVAQPIPYGQHWISENDIEAVAEVLRSGWLTTGPQVEQLERAMAEYVAADQAIAVSSGTAALHCAMHAIGIGPGDEVIVPSLTFAATANCVVYQGGIPVFADVDRDTLLVDPNDVARKISLKTRAIISVDYAGQPCEYTALREIADRHGLVLVADACHALGATYQGHSVGSIADLTTFSLHPVKHITAGEGGVVTTNNKAYADRIRRFRNHGINKDLHQRQEDGSWSYEISEVGYNYRLSDIQCALAVSQLKRLPAWILRRQEIAARYDQALAGSRNIHPLRRRDDADHAYHLYVVRCRTGPEARRFAFEMLRQQGIGVNVHYLPVHLHPYYKNRSANVPGACPCAEQAYEEILSLPIFPKLGDEDLQRVLKAVIDVDRRLETFRAA